MDERVMEAINLTLGKKPDKFKSVKDFLYRVRDAERRVNLIERRIEYREDTIGAHGMTYSEHLPNGSNYSNSSVETAVMALDALDRDLRDAKNSCSDAKVSVSEFIATLPDINQQMVITKKYIDGQSWEDIALDMDMSVRTVQKHHGRALPLLQEVLEKAS